jgi:hypothetical protein
MKMNATHQLKDWPHLDVTAWRFDRQASVPAWVFRNFHNLGDGDLTGPNGHKVKEGQWIVVDFLGPKVAFVLTDQEFNDCFKPLGAAQPVLAR